MLFDYQHGTSAVPALSTCRNTVTTLWFAAQSALAPGEAGLDEITIFTWAPGAYQRKALFPCCRGEEAQDDRRSASTSQTGQGCFFCSTVKERFADEAGRRFIIYLLQPVELLSQTQLPDEYECILSVAQGMLPQWNHRPVDFGGITAPFNRVSRLSSSTFQQPELVELAGAIRILLLRRWHIRAEMPDRRLTLQQPAAPPADIWLSNFMLDALSVPAFSGMAGFHPLFTRLPGSQRRQNLNACCRPFEQR